MNAPQMSEIGLVLYPGAQLAAVHGLTDLFRVANKAARDDQPILRVTHWRIAEGAADAVSDSHPGTLARPSFVLVPLTLTELPDPPMMADIVRWLRDRHASGVTLGSMCSGIFVLAETGLLAGRAVATHFGCGERLARDYPDVRIAVDRSMVDAGDIVTAGGFLSWFDIGMRIVERILGPEAAVATARRLSAQDQMPDATPPEAFVPKLGHGDDAISRAQRSIHRCDGRDVSLAALAQEAGLEKRTFLRRFSAATGHTPLDYCRQVRIARAREWLESSNRTVAAIGFMVGYADAKAFARAFRRATGVAPMEYRRQVGGRRLRQAAE